MEIKSQLSIAQSHASQFSATGSTLAGIGEVAKDDSTTVAGNAKAHESLKLAQSARQKVFDLLSHASTNIHSVASEFESVDANQAQAIRATKL
ncbi:type VII secretion effector [Streptococcus criceti]|uniref:TIGR04197 family type VII secretion effector n=1 Tax=Streptococcus criceti TaxID=1333 RepID=UPI000DFB2EB8|nr:TIGR04197 family type VII secretion effector [Streptococcus criceti]SUN43212.1 type VII secretion effector [Streptococcus criceti]